MAIAVNIVDAPNRRPVLIGLRGPSREASLASGVGPRPLFLDDVVRSMRRMTQG